MDILYAIIQSGAYGASASPQGFLSMPDIKAILLSLPLAKLTIDYKVDTLMGQRFT